MQIGGFLMALRTKGETVDEIEGLARTMLAFARHVEPPEPVIDTCGTGGDRSGTFNISTLSAIVVAGCGVPVAKHGNRAASSHCGSADVLEALGVRIDLDATGVERCLAEAGIGFMFAPNFHPAMGHAGPVRGELRVPTVFNFLGPLTNPARPHAQVVGVSDERMLPLMAEVLARRGVRAKLFRGEDGLDELTTTGISTVYDVKDGAVRETHLDPAAYGLAPAKPDDLAGGDAEASAAIARVDPRRGARAAARRRPPERRRRAGGRRVRGGHPRGDGHRRTCDRRGQREGDARPMGRGLAGRVASAADDPVRPRHPRRASSRPHHDRPVRPGVRPAVVGRPARRLAVPRLRELPLPVHRRTQGDAGPYRAGRGEAGRGVHPAPGGVRARLDARAGGVARRPRGALGGEVLARPSRPADPLDRRLRRPRLGRLPHARALQRRQLTDHLVPGDEDRADLVLPPDVAGRDARTDLPATSTRASAARRRAASSKTSSAEVAHPRTRRRRRAVGCAPPSSGAPISRR